MTKKYQLLLHIGLHKTATTSLQNNVLYPLHKQGKINCLTMSPKYSALRAYTTAIISKKCSNNTKQVTNFSGGGVNVNIGPY